MSTRFLKTAALMVLATASAFALADDDTPSRVGRISLAQGQVDIAADQNDEIEPALVNWPVASHTQLTTGRDGRTEVRIGSTALRLDADTAIDVNELDDNTLRITLHYGSLSVRVRNPDLLRGFELDTPQGMVRLQDTGRVRVDAGRRADTTAVSVFEGEATFDGAGSRLIVRSGKRAEITRDDVRTGLAMRDSFDEWGIMRDVRDERSESVRYVTSEMTGYEDLDQHGSWSQNTEYGPVWYPRTVSAGWVPYRDGRWTYLAPWGWTWVDNAPWGYAPFHYGRWVTVGGRWCWSPGRNITRAVWSPALVGWVGGSNWNVSFNSGGNRRAAPATGWYPLNPHDTYVPTYRVNHDNLRYLNRNAGDDSRGRYRPDNRERAGLTVVPHDQFRQRGIVVVPTAPRAIVSAAVMVNAPTMVPPAPVVVHQRENRGNDWRGQDRNGDARPDRFQRDRNPIQIGNQNPAPRPSPIVSNPSQPNQQGGRPATVLTLPSQPQSPAPRRVDLPELRRENTSSMPTPAPALPPQLQNQQQRDERFNRGERNDPERERRSRGAESWQQQNAQQQQERQQQLQQQQQQQVQQQQMQQRQQQERQQQERQQMERQQQYQQQQQQQQIQQQQQAQQRQQQERQQQERQQQERQQFERQQQQQRSAPPSMPSPQVLQQQQPQQQAPRQAPPPAQQEKAEKPAPRAMTTDEGKRRAREDMDRR